MKPSLPILALIAIAATTEATDPVALINLKSKVGNFVLSAAASAIQAKQNLVKSSTAAIINAKANFLQKQIQQIPLLVRFKNNQINSFLELKKNFIKSKAGLIGQVAGGNAVQALGGTAIQAAEQDVAAYSPPAAPPGPPIEQPSYSPLPPLQQFAPAGPPVELFAPAGPPVQQFAPAGPPVEQFAPAGPPVEQFAPAGPPVQHFAPAGLPVEEPQGPYPPPSSYAKRQTSREPVENARAQPSFPPQQTPSYESRYNRNQYSDFPTPPPPPPSQHVQYV